VKTFAETLKRLMKERNVSAKVLSQATGIPQSSLSEYLSGTRSATLGIPILKLARFFGVSLEYLVTGEHPEHKIVEGVLQDLDSGFTRIHSGVYRINVEKLATTHCAAKDCDEDG